MALRGLLFDFDGLIVDTETPSMASWQALYREHGHELPVDEWVTLVGTIGAPFDPMAHLVALAGPLDEEAAHAWRLDHELELSDVEQLRPGVLAYLEGARRLGLDTAIVSSSSQNWVHRHLRRLERVEHFDLIVTADGDPDRAKPSPTLYLEALDRLGLPAGDAVAFEDSPNGIAAAKAAGIFTVAVPNGVTAALGLDAADILVSSLEALPLDDLIEQRRAA